MIDVSSIFKNKTPDADKLTAYGFHSSLTGYEKSVPIMNGQFRVLVSVTTEGTTDFRVYDNDSDEEYILAHVYNSTGTFVGVIHKECEAILKDIAGK